MRYFIVVLALSGSIMGLLLLRPVYALSTGCTAVNFGGGPIMTVTTPSHTFAAGETIVATFGAATTAANARMEIPPGTQVAAGATTGALSYTFAADTTAAVRLTAEGGGDIQFTLGCSGTGDGAGATFAGGNNASAPNHGVYTWNPGDNRIAPSTATGLNAYCTPNGIEVYSANGGIALFVPLSRIQEVGIPAANTLLASGGGLEVWRQPNTFFEIVDVFMGNRRELLIVDFFNFPNSCEVRRWRRAYTYPNDGFTDIYEQSSGWGDAPRQVYF